MRPFLRRVRIDVQEIRLTSAAVIESYQTAVKGRTFDVISTQSFYGDGTPDGFRIRFHLYDHVMAATTPSSIQIYNLKPETRNSLLYHNPKVKVSVYIGWEFDGDTRTDQMYKIFEGDLLTSIHQREGTDIVTTIYAQSGRGASKLLTNLVSGSYDQSTSVADIVLDIAKNIPGILIDSKLIAIDPNKKTGPTYTYYGSISDVLDEMSRYYGFSWTIRNGYFQAITDGYAFSSGAVISNKNGFLIRAEPLLSFPMQWSRGVSVQSVLNPYVGSCFQFYLQSDMNPDWVDGHYVAHSVSHSGDTHSSNWNSNLEALSYRQLVSI